MEEITEFIKTDFPDPVVPATKICGILDKSATTALPETSSPRGTASFDFAFCSGADSSMVFKETISRDLFGISIPTRFLPGIGASILICPVGASVASARSFARAVIFESFVPRAISRAYWVTDGPTLIYETLD